MSLAHLLQDILLTMPSSWLVSVLVVDDGSDEPITSEVMALAERFDSFSVIVLKTNLGHQRAIAVGLAKCLSFPQADYTVVMDSDGEDPAVAIWRLIDIAECEPGSIVVASRGKRAVSLSFRLAYWLYKLVFRIATGTRISFGNFCVLPRNALRGVALSETIWTHFAATVARSRTPLVRERIDRDQRFDGESRMNATGLINHGLGAISAYSDRLFVRLVAVSLVALVLASLALLVVVAVRTFTDLGVPGWATSAAGIAVIISIQVFALIALSTFLVLLQRQRIELPLDAHVDSFIDEIRGTTK